MKRLGRLYHVLAIESSCDDASVALIQRCHNSTPVVLEHEKLTLDSTESGGIIPRDASLHHQTHLAPAVKRILVRHPLSRPKLVCATRGPGMRGSLSPGLNLAKGLALAWDVPLVGVHHMLGHLLSVRFASNGTKPEFPFLSLLVSGGHTLLVYSSSAIQHKILANTIDIAVGDSLDKCARELGLRGTMLGQQLELFASSKLGSDAASPAIQLPNPLQNSGTRVNVQAFSFAGFISALKTAAAKHFSSPLSQLPSATRQSLANQIQDSILHHLVSKVQHVLRLSQLENVKHFVLAGGVASNCTLRRRLRESLPRHMNLHVSDPAWCSDNAMMIAWAGIELWESYKVHSDLSVLPLPKWPLDEMMSAPGVLTC